jgi:hypothetical protein
MTEIKGADDRIQGLLALAGVKREEWRLPLELWERPPAGKPINHDDLIDFHIALGGLPEACPERRADPPRSRGGTKNLGFSQKGLRAIEFYCPQTRRGYCLLNIFRTLFIYLYG